MEIFRIYINENGYGFVDVEAESLDDAKDLALNMLDNGEFNRLEDTYSYNISEVDIESL